MKLGGSVITVKEKKFTPDINTINRIVGEISKANPKSIVIIHGGGSFGHPLAKQYKLVNGYSDPRQLIGFSKTRQAMRTLNKIVIDYFIHHNLPAVAIQPSACIITKNGRIHKFDFESIQKLLSLGFIPVLFGDVVLDYEKDFSILSGDQLTTKLAGFLNATRIILAVDVDGLFTKDPKLSKKAELIEKISLCELKSLLQSIGIATTVDVTKGMRGKIAELIPAIEDGIKITIVNAKKTNYLYKALKGEKVRSTEIE
jgi:isopentenyl phosphate kinase